MQTMAEMVVCVVTSFVSLNEQTPESETPKSEFRTATQADTHASFVVLVRVRDAPLFEPYTHEVVGVAGGGGGGDVGVVGVAVPLIRVSHSETV